MNTDIYVTTRANAFRQGVRTYRFLVRPDAVRVWDQVAGYYTTCHSLSATAERRIRELAKIAS